MQFRTHTYSTVQVPELHTDQRIRTKAGLKESWVTLKSVSGLTRSLSLQRRLIQTKREKEREKEMPTLMFLLVSHIKKLYSLASARCYSQYPAYLGLDKNAEIVQ